MSYCIVCLKLYWEFVQGTAVGVRVLFIVYAIKETVGFPDAWKNLKMNSFEVLDSVCPTELLGIFCGLFLRYVSLILPRFLNLAWQCWHWELLKFWWSYMTVAAHDATTTLCSSWGFCVAESWMLLYLLGSGISKLFTINFYVALLLEPRYDLISCISIGIINNMHFSC